MRMGKETTEGHRQRGGRATPEPQLPPQGNTLRGRTGKRPGCETKLKSRKRSGFGTSGRENETCTQKQERVIGLSKSRCRSTCSLANGKEERLRDGEGFRTLSPRLHPFQNFSSPVYPCRCLFLHSLSFRTHVRPAGSRHTFSPVRPTKLTRTISVCVGPISQDLPRAGKRRIDI